MNIKKLVRNLQQIWTNKKQILQGLFFKVIKYDNYVEDIRTARFSICMDCPKFDGIGSKCLIPGTQPCCGECGCSLSIKLRSMSTECPLGKWKAVMTEQQEDKLNK